MNFSYLISQVLKLEREELKEIAKKGVGEKEKSVKTTVQSISSSSGKRKSFGAPSTWRFGRG